MSFDQMIVKGTTHLLIEVFMRSSTTGQPLTGLNPEDFTVKYIREGGLAQNLGAPEALSTLGRYETDCIKETAISGVYQYGVPKAALAPGARAVTFFFTATGALTSRFRIVLTGMDVHDQVRGGFQALPNKPLLKGRSVTLDA